MAIRILVALAFLASMVVAFLAEPSAAVVLFPAQNAVTILLAGAQTMLVIGRDPVLWCIFLTLSAVAGLLMRTPLAEKSPSACVMFVTAGQLVFERLQAHSPELGCLVRRVGTAVSNALSGLSQAVERQLNAL